MSAEPLNFNPYLINGLRWFSDMPRGAPYMKTCTNLLACERRLKQLPSWSWPSTFPDKAATWPYADVFHSDRVALTVIGNEFEEINLSDLSTSAISLYNATSTGDAYAVSGSGVWDFCTFLDSWFATNGTSLVYKAPSTASNKVVGHHADLAVSTVANWNNRLILGGVSGDRLADSSFTDIVALWRKRNKRNVVSSEDDSFDTTWLIIGPPVGGDSSIPNGAILGLLGLPSDTAYTTVFEAQMRSWVEQGIVDLLPLRHTGAIYWAKQQGPDLVVLGQEGASRITMTEIGPIEQDMCPVGVLGRGTVGGNTDERLFIGQDDQAYMIGEGATRYGREGVYVPERVGPGCYRLGGSEFFSTLTAADVRISYDPTEQRYWVADGDDCFVLSRTGLSRSLGLIPSTVVRLPGQTALIGASKVYVHDGDFSAPANWITGAGWSIGSNQASATASDADLSQPESDMENALTNGVSYLVEITVSNYSAGSFTVALNGGTPSAAIDSDGTHQIAITSGSGTAGIIFSATGLTCKISNLRLQPEDNETVTLRTVAFDLGRRDPFTVERLDLTTTDTASDSTKRWKARMHSKLRKHDSLTTFSYVTSDSRGVASVEQVGVEHEIELYAAVRTAVDLDGAVAMVDLQKTPEYRGWLNTVS